MEALKTLSDKEKLFLWLYFPYDIADVDKTLGDMIALSVTYNINNDTILLRKIIEYLYIKNHNKEQIIEKLYQYKLINVDVLHKVIDTIDTVISTPLNSLDNVELSKIIGFADKYNVQINHEGYPKPDPNKGRPFLDWCECYFDGCHKHYDTPEQLKTHLTQLGKHIWGFHFFHERAIGNMWLTPEKVLANNMTKCPSLVCDKSNHIFTPQELCQHFQVLGLAPFYQLGDIIHTSKKFTEDKSFNKVYMSQECIICTDDDVRPSVLFLPCNHCVVCINCYKPMNKCPICRRDIATSLPI